jgi:hypothetical protein
LAEDNCCGGARNFAGLIDDVAIWNEALTGEQIAALHSGAATPLTIPEPSTLVLAMLACLCLTRSRASSLSASFEVAHFCNPTRKF